MGRRLLTREILIASHNEGKVREIAALLRPFVDRIRWAEELGLTEPEETESTFTGNARLKAVAAARGSNLVALADDSGLLVAALQGDPGVRSARWAGPERDFDAAMERVHHAVEAAGGDRRAEMACALALAWPDGYAECFEGRVEGELVWPPRGELGFGYEPMFRPRGEERTYGQMPRAQKHVDDPRARAFARLRAACLE